MHLAAGILTSTGGMTSHARRSSPEVGNPAGAGARRGDDRRRQGHFTASGRVFTREDVIICSTDDGER